MGQNHKKLNKTHQNHDSRAKLHMYWTFDICVFHDCSMSACCNMGCGSFGKAVQNFGAKGVKIITKTSTNADLCYFM